MMNRVMLCAALAVITGCEEEEEHEHEEAVECEAPTQGVSGSVLRLEGNHMPSDGPGSGGSTEAVSTTVAAFEIITDADAVEDTSDPEAYGRYDFGEAEPVATTTSDEEGCFSMALDEGSYTVVADDGGAWFCNSFNDSGLCVITVEADGAVEFDIEIDYGASF